jgi:hypothetical protein
MSWLVTIVREVLCGEYAESRGDFTETGGDFTEYRGDVAAADRIAAVRPVKIFLMLVWRLVFFINFTFFLLFWFERSTLQARPSLIRLSVGKISGTGHLRVLPTLGISGNGLGVPSFSSFG